MTSSCSPGKGCLLAQFGPDCAILPFSILSDCCACGDCVGMGVDGSGEAV
uniref:Uncharacterized protein n=1 Tax=Anguilla anguilla TaxID=7936 RepID=A0A0E9S9C7_ANGAN